MTKLKHNVFKDQAFKSPATAPSLPGVTNGCEGVKKAEGMPYPVVTFVSVKGK